MGGRWAGDHIPVRGGGYGGGASGGAGCGGAEERDA
jgi:hypothetical protein